MATDATYNTFSKKVHGYDLRERKGQNNPQTAQTEDSRQISDNSSDETGDQNESLPTGLRRSKQQETEKQHSPSHQPSIEAKHTPECASPLEAKLTAGCLKWLSANWHKGSFLVISTLMVVVAFRVIAQPTSSINSCDANNLAKLTAKYEATELSELWGGVKSAVKLCHQTSKPQTLLVLHSNDSNGVNCLVTNIAGAVSCNINDDKADGIFELDSRNVSKLFDASTFLESVQKKRDELRVVVFTHVEALPVEYAKDLHFICDPSHRAPKSVIILLLKVEDDVLSKNKDLYDVARKKLGSLWEANLKQRFDPIWGRISSNIVAVSAIPEHVKELLPCE